MTGSAHCTVGPYWSAQLGTEFGARQLSPRGGYLHVSTTDGRRVELRGRARTAVTGTFHRTP